MVQQRKDPVISPHKASKQHYSFISFVDMSMCMGKSQGGQPVGDRPPPKPPTVSRRQAIPVTEPPPDPTMLVPHRLTNLTTPLAASRPRPPLVMVAMLVMAM